MLFAQFQPRNGPQAPIPPEALGIIVGAVCCGALIGLSIAILYYLNLSRLLQACRPRNRAMEPGMVWLNFIPLFNIYWWYRTYNAISDSLENEFRDRGWPARGESFCRPLGAAMFWLNLLSIPLSVAGQLEPIVGVVNLPIGIAQFVMFIMYWVRTYKYRQELTDDGDRGDDRRDDYDDRRDDYDDRRDRDYNDRRDRDDDDDRPRRRDDDDYR